MGGRLHLVDGTYELFRAHYSKRPSHRMPNGQDGKGVLGLAQSLLALLDDPKEAVTHVGVAFDRPIESFRNDLFEGYKTGEGIDPDLLAQFELAEEATSALGVVVWRMIEFEADDALATAAKKYRKNVDQVRIMTPDKDLGQCVDGSQVVQVDRMRERVFDEAGVVERMGVPPASVPDLLALVGDSADGIPGLPGFGEKSAAKLLARYSKLEKIPARAEDWDVDIRGAERLCSILREHREEAKLYRRLATLVTKVPLPERFSDLRFRGVPKARFAAFCDKIGRARLLERPKRWAEAG